MDWSRCTKLESLLSTLCFSVKECPADEVERWLALLKGLCERTPTIQLVSHHDAKSKQALRHVLNEVQDQVKKL